MSENTIVSYSAEELTRMPDASDWERVDALTERELEEAIAQDTDSEIEPTERLSISRIEELLSMESLCISVNLRINEKVLAYFKRKGVDYERHMGAVLKAYVAYKERRPHSGQTE
jgi:uncharacterized protein (DUF4415 family)